jgi:uncharacterized protein (TIGR02246 family)
MEEIMKCLAGVALAASLIVMPALAHAQSAPVDTKADIQQIATDWMNAYNKQDAATIAQMYAEDAVFSTAGWTANGRTAIQEAVKQDIAGGGKVTAITVDQSHRIGDLNYSAGAWTANMKGPDGKEAPVGGHWAVVSKYQNGHYLTLVHNSNMALPPPK